jgi:pyrimidine deaminase RibD-like protein
MIEPIFTERSKAALALHVSPETARDAALVFRATNLAIESAFTYAQDFPCGAVVAAGNWIVGQSFASDRRHGFAPAHAEFMAVGSAKTGMVVIEPDTIAVTLEPCGDCQDFIATQPSIKRVVFGLGRTAASSRGLVKPKNETIFERARRVGLPYEIVHVDDPQLQRAGEIILDSTARNTQTGEVSIDLVSLQDELATLTNS